MGKQRPLGIPALRDRIVQRAMLMAMEPIWENDFHSLSYGFRPERSVHHRLLMKCVRKRISCNGFLDLLWRFIKSGHVERNLFCATHQGVPQGGVISPLLSNIMLNEFDQYLHQRYLSKKARKDRWYLNNSIKIGRRSAIENNWQWQPAVAYCRYADDCSHRQRQKTRC